MAVTMNNVRRIVAGNSVRIVGSITGPASYTTGGETLSTAQIAVLTDGDSTTSLTSCLTFDSEVVPTSFRAMILDRTNKKLMFTTAFAEVASLANLSAVTINFESIVRVANQGAGKTV